MQGRERERDRDRQTNRQTETEAQVSGRSSPAGPVGLFISSPAAPGDRYVYGPSNTRGSTMPTLTCTTSRSITYSCLFGPDLGSTSDSHPRRHNQTLLPIRHLRRPLKALGELFEALHCCHQSSVVAVMKSMKTDLFSETSGVCVCVCVCVTRCRCFLFLFLLLLWILASWLLSTNQVYRLKLNQVCSVFGLFVCLFWGFKLE